MMVGADISALPVLGAAGAVYSANGTHDDAIKILADSGITWSRLRLFVEPKDNASPIAVNDLPYTIALAKRVKAIGNKLLLDIHYSDTWADPGKQFKPAAWESLGMSDLRLKMRCYSRDTLVAFKKANALPDMVQVGNEITNGMLWPDGRLWNSNSNEAAFDRLASLLQAGIAGVREGVGESCDVEIMLHFDNPARWKLARSFFDELVERHVDFDTIGYSYHPFHHYDGDTGKGSIADLAETLRRTALRYKKPVVIVETAFPYRGAEFEPDYEYAISVAGQKRFLNSLAKAVESTPNNLGHGVFWWFPEAVPPKGHEGS